MVHVHAHHVLRYHDEIAILFASSFRGDDALSAHTLCVAVCALPGGPHVGPTLTDRHRNERRRWAGRYRHWRLQRWHGVLFPDESSSLDLLMVGCGCVLGMKNVIITTTLSRRTGGVEGVSWCWVGSVIISE